MILLLLLLLCAVAFGQQADTNTQEQAETITPASAGEALVSLSEPMIFVGPMPDESEALLTVQCPPDLHEDLNRAGVHEEIQSQVDDQIEQVDALIGAMLKLAEQNKEEANE